MAHADDYYDFHCGNDPRLVKIAIKNDAFHTITIRANIARTIDFSGGTRKVEAIRINKCFKTTRIIWPEHTGAIRRLYINHADTLARLDISALTSLEELSILDCRSLEEIIGLPATLKEINVHHTKINKMDLKHSVNLQKINIATNSSQLNLNSQNNTQLQIAIITTNKTNTEKSKPSIINLGGCNSLHILYVDAGENAISLDVSACTGLKEAAVICGEGSDMSGFQDCKQALFFHASKDLNMNEVSKRHAKQVRSHQTAEKLENLFNLSQHFYAITRLNKPGIHDREIVVQESGSQIEVDKVNGARITMLAMPVDIHIATSKKDLSKELRAFMIDNTYLPSGALPIIYYLPELPFVTRPTYGIPASRIVSTQQPAENIVAWLQNSEGLFPNVLQINQNTIKSPEVINLLNQVQTKRNEITLDGTVFPLQPFDKILVTGDWYYIKNFLPNIAVGMTAIPAAAFALPSAGAFGFPPEAIAAFQDMLLESNKALTARMMQNNKSLSNRSKNLQILRQAAEIKKYGKEFFDALSQLSTAIKPKNDNLIDQAPIGGRSKTPEGPINIDAHAQKSFPPEPIDQHGIDADANAATPAADLPLQTLIDAESNAPEDLIPKRALQVPIDVKHRASGLDSAPPLTPASRHQQLIATAKRLADQVKVMTENVEGIPDQILIHAESAHRATPPAAEEKILLASLHLANALKKMADNACAISTEKSSASSHAAASIINTTIADLKKNAKDPPLYDAAADIIVAIKLLNKACNEELSADEKSKLENDQSTEMQNGILKILVNARHQYVKDHDLLNPGTSLFGRTPGKEEMRAEILSRFIDALSNKAVLDSALVDKDFSKLMKDHDLKYALGGIEDEIKKYLTGVKRPAPKPMLKNDL